jgi:antitoxin ParD1/3/4/toxin ParE1/3/4
MGRASWQAYWKISIQRLTDATRDEPLFPGADGQEDLLAIREYYVKQAGPRIARQILVEFVGAFRRIAQTPGIGHKREDLAEDRPVLFWPMRDFLIIYRATSDPVEIVTIARGSRDVAAIIRRTTL